MMKSILATAIISILFIAGQTTFASELYFTGGHSHVIRQIDTSTGQINDITTNNGNLSDLEYDSSSNQIYWAISSGYGAIGRYDLNSNENETLLQGYHVTDGFERIASLALDTNNNHIYFSDLYNGGIYRSDIQGQNIENLIEPGVVRRGSHSVEINLEFSKIFWFEKGYIQSSNLDGTMNEQISASRAASLDIDHINNTLYWSSDGMIMRSNLDGSGINAIIDTGLVITALAVDPDEGKLFWGARQPNGMQSHHFLQSCNLDGSSMETVVDLGIGYEDQTAAMCLIPEPATIALLSLGGIVTLRKRKRITA